MATVISSALSELSGAERKTSAVKEDNVTLIKSAKLTHNIQREKLALKSQDEYALLEEIRSYLKRRAEIEWQYCEEQTKLAMQFLQTRKQQKPGKSAADGEDKKLLLKGWTTLLEESRTYARTRGVFAEKLRENFTTPMKPFGEEKKRTFTKQNDFLGQKIQADLHTSFSELQAAKQLYDHCARDAEKAQQKYDDAMKAPTGTLNKLFFKVTREKLDQARKRQKAATRKAQDARNMYILKLEAVNAHQHHYYANALPQLMKNMDNIYFDQMRDYLTEFGDMETQNFKEAITSMSRIITAAGKINRDLENKDYLQENISIFSPPRPFALELFGNEKVSVIEVDEYSKAGLSLELSKLKERQEQLEEAIAKKEKELEALKKITKVYDATPSFGRAADAQDGEETLAQERDLLVVEKVRVDAQVRLLISAGVVLNSSIKKPKKDITPQGSFSSGTHTCVALYDYTPQNADELAIQQNDVITILEDGPEWIKGSLNGKEGYLPATYVTKTVVGNGGSASHGSGRAQALFDFSGNEEDLELSFRAGDIIEIITRGTIDDPNFWEGKLNGKTGFFPAEFVAELDSDEDSIASESDGRSRGADTEPETSSSSRLSLAPPSTMPRAASGGNINTMFAPPEKQPQKFFVISLYDYTAQVDGELSFAAGERIEVTNRDIGSEAWWEGKNQAGEVGQFPTAYVSEIKTPSPLPSRRPTMSRPRTETVVALYDYEAKDSDELTIRPGDVIELIATDLPDDATKQWWEGKLNGRTGRFPMTYVRKN